MQALYGAYEQMDASLLEINPFLLTKDKRLIALDAKVNFDDNALYRHQDFLHLRDLNEEEPLEIEASKFDLNYIKLDGNIACMVNGAGLAMATMDIIKLAGGEPETFWMSAAAHHRRESKRALQNSARRRTIVRAVLINISADRPLRLVARGVVGAAQNLGSACRRCASRRDERGRRTARHTRLRIKLHGRERGCATPPKRSGRSPDNNREEG